MQVEIRLSDRRWEQFFKLHKFYEKRGNSYTNEELINKILGEAIRARYNAEKREEPEPTPEQLAEDEATAIEYGFLVVEERGE